MAKNVHIEQVTKVRIPAVATEEDRGLQFCTVPIRAFATLDSVDLEKNSRLGLAFKFDSMTISLIRQRDGVEIPAPGIVVNFPNQSDAVGFVIDWRQLTRTGPGGTELDQGCYQVKVSWTLGIAAGFFFETSVELFQFNNFNTEGYVNMFVVLNDVLTTEGISINYKDSGFATTIAFKGQFGYMQPGYLITNNIYSPENERRKVRILPVRTYELRTNRLLSCATQQIDERFLLAANQIFITDFNANNHVQKRYTNFPVIISEEESPVFEYDTSIYAKMTVIFKDKQQIAESKYDGDIKGSDNIILELPVLIGGPAPTVSLSAELMKTGQTISFATGDDGDLEAGREVDFNTLPTNNVFGNPNRFTDELGGQTYTLGLIVDHSTNSGTDMLMYSNTELVGATWPNQLTAAQAVSIGTFTTGWHLTNRHEMENIIDSSSVVGAITGIGYAPFSFTAGNYWTSTTAPAATTSAYHLNTSAANIVGLVKTLATVKGFPCRVVTHAELGV